MTTEASPAAPRSPLAERIVDTLVHRIGKDERAARQHDWLAATILTVRDEERARAYIARSDELRREFDALVNGLIHSTEPALHAVPRALLYRFLKRITAHSMNVVTAVVMPVDRLDYYDEADDTRT